MYAKNLKSAEAENAELKKQLLEAQSALESALDELRAQTEKVAATKETVRFMQEEHTKATKISRQHEQALRQSEKLRAEVCAQ